jgi:hypothetical protein
MAEICDERLFDGLHRHAQRFEVIASGDIRVD